MGWSTNGSSQPNAASVISLSAPDLAQDLAGADRGRDEDDRQEVELADVLDVEDADPRQRGQQPDADADHRRRNVVDEIGHPQTDRERHQRRGFLLRQRQRSHAPQLVVQEAGAARRR